MNIEFLKMFLEVVKCKSIRKASAAKSISQSALSQEIQTMEKILNVKIFDRTHKGVELTEAGRIVYKHAVAIIALYNKMIDEISNYQNKSKRLHISATSVACSYALPCTLYHIKNKFPSYVIEMETLTSNVIEKNIALGIGDIGIVVGKPESDALIYKKVCADQYYLVAGFHMEVPQEITFEELYKFPLLMLSKTQKSRKILDEYFLSKGLDIDCLNILYDLDSIESIKISAIQEYGLAFLPYMAIKKELYNKQLKIIKLKEFNFTCEYYAIKRKQDANHSEHLSIISYIEKIIQETVC
jgi:DNA-binding transcriptional LysR family regulator